MKRRSFLGLLGVAPLAAKQVLDESIMRQTGMTIGTQGSDVSGGLPQGGSTMPGQLGNLRQYVPYGERVERASRLMRWWGIPKEVKEQVWLQARWVHQLDPDIASKRSWSMSYKALVQRERNYHRILDGIDGQATAGRIRKNLEEFFGFEWPFQL
jgi:hypothetical protein